VGPRRREPEMPTARRAGDDRGGVRPQIDGARMPEAHRVWRSEDRSGLEMVPDLGGRESFSSPSDRGSDRGGWSSPSGRGGDWGFARPAHPSHFGGRGISRR
jgi:hypothetical protein